MGVSYQLTSDVQTPVRYRRVLFPSIFRCHVIDIEQENESELNLEDECMYIVRLCILKLTH